MSFLHKMIEIRIEISFLQVMMEMLICVFTSYDKNAEMSFLQVLIEMLKCLFTSVEGNVEMSFFTIK